MIRFLSLLLCAVTVLSSFASCGKDIPEETAAQLTENAQNPVDPQETTDTKDTSSDTSEPVTPPEDLFDTPESFVVEKKDYALNVEISRPQKSQTGSIDIEKAQYIGMFLSDKVGVSPSLTTDFLRVEDSEKFEIIVGATDHPETKALLDTMSYGDYAVRAVGNKIIILAFSEEGYELAYEHFKNIVNKGLDKTDKKVTLKTSELNITESCHDQLAALPTYDGGKTVMVYDAGRVTATTDCDEIIIGSTMRKNMQNILKSLMRKDIPSIPQMKWEEIILRSIQTINIQ